MSVARNREGSGYWTSFVVAIMVGATIGLALGFVIDNLWVSIPVSVLVGMVFGDLTHHLLREEREDGDEDAV